MQSLPSRPLQKPRIAVIGDLILDRYTWGQVERISPEAPIPVFATESTEIRPGGAANVANLLSHLDAEVSLFGVIGNDFSGQALLRVLNDQGVDVEHAQIASDRPTTEKHRFVGKAGQVHPHQILRVDQEDCTSISLEDEQAFIDAFEAKLPELDSVVISDYAKGFCTVNLLLQVIQICRLKGIPVLVDPAKDRDLKLYQNATLITPNRMEAGQLIGRTILHANDAVKAAQQLREAADLDAVVITLDREGIVLSQASGELVMPTVAREVYDITGAGDVVISILAYGLAAHWNLADATQAANIAAGLEVEKMGVVPITWDEIEQTFTPQADDTSAKVCSQEEVIRFAKEAKQQGKTVAFTNGCFDLFHVGHLCTLHFVSKLGTVLIVGVNSDQSVQQNKGKSRPIVNQHHRAELLAALPCVDRVVIYDDETPVNLLQAIQPDVLCKGGTTEHVVGREIVESYGGQVVRATDNCNVSTTFYINKIQRNQRKGVTLRS